MRRLPRERAGAAAGPDAAAASRPRRMSSAWAATASGELMSVHSPMPCRIRSATCMRRPSTAAAHADSTPRRIDARLGGGRAADLRHGRARMRLR